VKGVRLTAGATGCGYGRRHRLLVTERDPEIEAMKDINARKWWACRVAGNKF
jgi:hypothetical protein